MALGSSYYFYNGVKYAGAVKTSRYLLCLNFLYDQFVNLLFFSNTVSWISYTPNPICPGCDYDLVVKDGYFGLTPVTLNPTHAINGTTSYR